MCDSDGESPEVYEDHFYRARKEHRCCACRETIRPGDYYHTAFGVWEGEVQTFKHCLRCWDVFLAIQRARDGEAIVLTLECGEDWQDTIGHLPEGVAALAFMTRDEAQARGRQP